MFRKGFWGVILILVVILALTLRIYRIDGTSMNYGLIENDIVISQRVFETIRRGDLLVMRHPEDPEKRLYIKRCAALPSDSFFEKNRAFYLQLESNSTKTKQWADRYRLTAVKTPLGYFLKEPYRRYYGVVHDWGLRVPSELTTLPFQKVKKGHYLLLGDFRDNSADSRFFGAVPRSWIMSKVILIVKFPRSWKALLKIKEAD